MPALVSSKRTAMVISGLSPSSRRSPTAPTGLQFVGNGIRQSKPSTRHLLKEVRLLRHTVTLEPICRSFPTTSATISGCLLRILPVDFDEAVVDLRVISDEPVGGDQAPNRFRNAELEGKSSASSIRMPEIRPCWARHATKLFEHFLVGQFRLRVRMIPCAARKRVGSIMPTKARSPESISQEDSLRASALACTRCGDKHCFRCTFRWSAPREPFRGSKGVENR